MVRVHPCLPASALVSRGGCPPEPAHHHMPHNAGLSPHTAANRPWRRLVVVEFDEEQPAVLFEEYLKTGSGRKFARRHFHQEISG